MKSIDLLKPKATKAQDTLTLFRLLEFGEQELERGQVRPIGEVVARLHRQRTPSSRRDLR